MGETAIPGMWQCDRRLKTLCARRLQRRADSHSMAERQTDDALHQRHEVRAWRWLGDSMMARPELTRKDWSEIYYALETKYGLVRKGAYNPEMRRGDNSRWTKHLRSIMDTIGPDGTRMTEEVTLSEDETTILFEMAKRALADGDLFDEMANHLDLSDATMLALREKLDRYLSQFTSGGGR